MTNSWDTHPDRDTHPRKDTHPEWDTHIPNGTPTPIKSWDTHRARPVWDTHKSWDTHPDRDTHSQSADTPQLLGHPSRMGHPHPERDTHPRKDTHPRRDTHVERDTHSQKDTHPAPRWDRGFVLVATLWTLAAMAVLAAYIDGVASADIERASAAKASLERELARRSTEATLTYLISTGRMNHRGLMLEPEQSFTDADGNRGPDRSVGVIAVSGETYAGLGGTRFSIQDENGLVPVNFPRTPQFTAALAFAGVAAADIERIVPRVLDYVDMDGDLSLNGAERFDYDRAFPPAPDSRAATTYRTSAVSAGPGMTSELRFPKPSNWSMATPLELRRVLGVTDVIAPDQWRRLVPMLTMRQTSGYNFNTMRPDVLAAVFDLNEGAVNNILAERAERSVASLNRVAMLTGTHLDIDPTSLERLPSRFLRISIWHNADGLRSLAGMALTPFGDAPWTIDYRYTEPKAPTERPEPAIDNESSDAGVLQASTPLLK